jgi:predicted  nucleic acid-binding Zn-ribbon protein
MIAARFHPAESSRQGGNERKGMRCMESLTSGTMAGTGSFRCQRCGYVLTLTSLDTLGDCPGCGGHDFARASLFSAARTASEAPKRQVDEAEPSREWLEAARTALRAPGEYVLYEDGQDIKAVALTREWTRIGRSLAADVRFDDPTVSRRHALVVRQADGVKVLDDRSLNGVFVNGERVEWRALEDGDEIIVGRYRLTFVSLRAASPAPEPGAPVQAVG